jgi:hypothetical protein
MNPRQRLNSNNASRINIAAKARIPAQLLLGSVTLSANRNGLGVLTQLRGNLGTNLLDRTKVNQHNSAILPPTNQVGRFEIAVNHALLMDKRENVQQVLQ